MNTQMFGFLYAMGASLVLAAAVHAQTTYYVNGDCGSNAWSGTGPVCAAPDGPKATIQAGINAASNGDEVVVADGVYTGAGNKNLDFAGRLITLRSANGPESCIIDCQGSGRGFYFHSGETTDAVVQGFTITNGSADPGGAIRFHNSAGTIIGCILSGNSGGPNNVGGGIASHNSDVTVLGSNFLGNSSELGGGIFSEASGSVLLTDCAFVANSAGTGGAIFTAPGVAATLQRCTFTDNEAGFLAGALSANGSTTTLISCTFIRNSSDFLIGAMVDQTDATLVNCVFSRNSGDLAGGLFTTSNSTLINSTFSGNFGGGITFGGQPGAPVDVTLANCILWGNTPYQIEEYADSGAGGTATVSFSDIQGGWTGPGGNNIDADPLFVQPGLDNVRLSFGSPCINVGSNAALPPDELDLDGDGDTDEPIPYDLDGNDRIQGGIVDMGAYEGEHEPLPPGSSASDMDLDQGETTFLIPGGGLFNPLETTAVMITNVSGPDNASVTVTEWYQSVHPGAGGYSDLTSTLTIETSLDDGQFLALVLLPFNTDVLGGIDPFQPNLTSFDPAIGNWGLAVAGNTVNSPGFPWPIGDRVIVEGPGGYELTQDPGDYGVYWLPSAQQGFVWANVDYAGDLALGAALCPPDCRQTPDGVVNVLDVLAVLTAWGEASGNGPCDLDKNGSVDQLDLLAVLSAWGPCSPSANSQGPFVGVRTVAAFTLPSRTSRVGNSGGLDRDPVNVVEPSGRGDLDGNGRVDRNDLLILRSSWGPCADGPDSCPTDLDGDGVVGVTDILTLLANWG